MNRIRLPFAAILAALATLVLPVRAEPVIQKTVCPACHGKKSLSLTPPNLGQYDGEIGVTPGRPFTTHRFDVKYKTCPLCDGLGFHETYRLTVKPPADAADLDPCPDCRWAGVTACRKCKGSGYLTCAKCQSGGAGKDGKPGWIVTQKSTTTGMRSAMKHSKMLVTPCGTCSGIGRIVCPDCAGFSKTKQQTGRPSLRQAG